MMALQSLCTQVGPCALIPSEQRARAGRVDESLCEATSSRNAAASGARGRRRVVVEPIRVNSDFFGSSLRAANGGSSSTGPESSVGGRLHVSAGLQATRDAPTPSPVKQRPPAVPKRGGVTLRLCLEHQVKFGERLVVLGHSEALGDWNREVAMEWTPNGWIVDLQALPFERLEFKFVVVGPDAQLYWEAGPNRCLQLLEWEGEFELRSQWGVTPVEQQVRLQPIGDWAPQEPLIGSPTMGELAMLGAALAPTGALAEFVEPSWEPPRSPWQAPVKASPGVKAGTEVTGVTSRAAPSERAGPTAATGQRPPPGQDLRQLAERLEQSWITQKENSRKWDELEIELARQQLKKQQAAFIRSKSPPPPTREDRGGRPRNSPPPSSFLASAPPAPPAPQPSQASASGAVSLRSTAARPWYPARSLKPLRVSTAPDSEASRVAKGEYWRRVHLMENVGALTVVWFLFLLEMVELR